MVLAFALDVRPNEDKNAGEGELKRFIRKGAGVALFVVEA